MVRIALACIALMTPFVRADDLPPGAILRIGNPLYRHRSQVQKVAWSPDGKRLASAGLDERIKVWEPESGRQIASFLARFSEMTMAWSPDGKKIAAGGWTHGGISGEPLTLWEVDTGRVVAHFPVPAREAAIVVAFSPDGKFLASGSITSKVYLWDVSTTRLVKILEDGSQWVKTLAFSPDGKLLAAGGQDRLIRLWDVTSGKLRMTLKDHSSDVCQLRFSPDGKTLASGDSLDTTVRLWKVESGKVQRFWRGGRGYVSSLDWSPDGKRLAASASSNGIVHILDVETGKSLGQMNRTRHDPRGAAYHPDGKTLATAGVEGMVRLWDLETFKEKPVPAGHLREVVALAFSPDNSTLLTGSPDWTIRLWDLKTGKETFRCDWPEQYWISSVAFSPNAGMLAVGGHNETQLFDGKTGKRLRQLKGQEGVAWQLAFSPDDKTLATGSNGGTIRWWNTTTGEKQREDTYPFQRAFGLRYRRNGDLLVDGFRNAAMHRYEWNNKADVFSVPFTQVLARLPVLSPDGRMLANIEPDHAIHLYETNTQQLRLRFVSDQKEDMISLAFSADGRRLATGSNDATVLIWDTMGTKDTEIQRLQQDLDGCWLKLGGSGAGEAYRAIRALAAIPDRAAPFLDGCLQGVNEKTRSIAKLIADLDHPRFAVREKATKELIDLGPAARSHLESALEGKMSLDAQRRIQEILTKLPKQGLPQWIRDLRAVEALERMATPAARTVLKRVAGGPAEDRVTREAKAALERIGE
jgi:WD40 repeat protein